MQLSTEARDSFHRTSDTSRGAARLVALLALVAVLVATTVRPSAAQPGASALHALSPAEPSAGGSIAFELSSTIPVGDNPMGSAVGDWDGDGDLDLAVSNHNTADISVLLNDGAGIFLLSQILSAEPWTYPPAAADFDSDGDLDLAMPGRAYGHILLYRNDGGVFSAWVTLSAGPEPQSVVVRDLDGDGHLDLAVLCNSAGVRKVIVFFGDGTGGFATSWEIILHTTRTEDFAPGDFDGDGDWDLYVPTYPQTILLNQGDGTFLEDPRPEMGDVGGTPAVADFDDDGDVDLAVPSHTAGILTFFENDGSGGFTAASTVPVSYGGRNVAAGDWDRDGDLDLAVPSGATTYTVYFLENDGEGVFTEALALGLEDPYSIATGDYDADADLDLVVASVAGDSVFILTNMRNTPASVAFTKITSGDIVNDGGYSSGACWGDYDNDGWLDLVVTNWMGQDNLLYHNEGDETFTKITNGPIVSDGGWSRGCTWGDYDNDGLLDLFVSNDGGGNFLYHNEDGASFTRVVTGPIPGDGGNCYSTAWADYDNDGWLDLFVARHTNANNLLYHNNRNGTFTKVTTGAIVNDGGYSVTVSWGDYDDDGCIDLFVGNVNSQNNLLYQNNCDGTFTKVTSGPVVNDGSFSSSSNAVDYDNDRDLDLFVANWDMDNGLYQNNGDGTFTRILNSLIVTEGDVHDSTWGDYDNDGDLDLFAGQRDDKQRLYQNNGDGTFSQVTTGPVVEDSGSSSGVWGDYDSDGDLDLFVAVGDGLDNLLYRNEGNKNHWINVKLVGSRLGRMQTCSGSNSSAIGARVILTAIIGGATVEQIREVSGQTGFLGQNSLDVEFGLGDAAEIESIVVEWPSGVVQTRDHVVADQFLTIREPGRCSTFLPFVGRNAGP